MLDRKIIHWYNKQLPAAGIIEVIIAMLLVCMVMICSTYVYTQLLDGKKGYLKIQAESNAQEVYYKTIHEKTFVSEEGVIGNLPFKKEVELYQGIADLYLIKISILNEKGDIIYNLNTLSRSTQ